MSNIKFGRNYRLTIEFDDGTPPVIIGLPFTIQFTVNRFQNSSLNTCYVDVYNLGPLVRDLIFKEPQLPLVSKTLTLEAGYDELVTIFKGSIYQASSSREGTNIVTSIECLSGQWQISTATVYQTLNQGQTLGDIYRFLAGQFPKMEGAAIGDFTEKLERPVVLNGNVWEILKRYSNNKAFIDNERLFILKNNEVVPGSISVISLDSGILQTPKRAGGFLIVSTLFEPRIEIKQEVNLVSTLQPIYNGTYQVTGVQHTGVISDAVNGDCRTTLNLFVGNLTFKTVFFNQGAVGGVQ